MEMPHFCKCGHIIQACHVVVPDIKAQQFLEPVEGRRQILQLCVPQAEVPQANKASNTVR
jgi:hypothetical protein